MRLSSVGQSNGEGGRKVNGTQAHKHGNGTYKKAEIQLHDDYMQKQPLTKQKKTIPSLSSKADINIHHFVTAVTKTSPLLKTDEQHTTKKKTSFPHTFRPFNASHLMMTMQPV